MAAPSAFGGPTDAGAARLVGLSVALLALLVAESSRGLVVSSMYTFIKDLVNDDERAATRVVAAAVSVFSVGRLIAAPLFGWMCDRYSFRSTIATCLVVSALGHALYAIAPNCGADGGGATMLVLARFVVGTGSGVLGVSRAIVAVLTTPEQRNTWFSLLSVAKFAGYALAPTVAVFINLDAHVGVVRVDRFTAPAELLVVANVLLLPVVWCALGPDLGKDPAAAAKQRAAAATPAAVGGLAASGALDKLLPSVAEEEAGGDGGAMSPAPAPAPVLRPSCASRALARASCGLLGGGGARRTAAERLVLAGVALFVTLNGISKGVLTLMEAVATPMFQSIYAGPDPDIVNETARWYAMLGAGGLVVYAIVAAPRKSAAWAPGDLTMLLASSLATAVGATLLARPWAPGSQPTFPLLDAGAALVWSVGAPIADVVAVSCFSIVVQGKAAQGAWMGTITMAGSVGRITFPLLTAVMPREWTLLVAAVLSLGGVPAIVAYRVAQARRAAEAADLVADAAVVGGGTGAAAGTGGGAGERRSGRFSGRYRDGDGRGARLALPDWSAVAPAAADDGAPPGAGVGVRTRLSSASDAGLGSRGHAASYGALASDVTRGGGGQRGRGASGAGGGSFAADGAHAHLAIVNASPSGGVVFMPVRGDGPRA